MFTYRKAHIVRYSCCICIDAINSYLLTFNRLHGLSTLFKFDLPFSLVAFLRRLGFHVFLCGQRFLATFAIFRDQVSKELFPFCNSVSHISIAMTRWTSCSIPKRSGRVISNCSFSLLYFCQAYTKDNFNFSLGHFRSCFKYF